MTQHNNTTKAIDDSIQVIGELDPKTVTYSRVMVIPVTRQCRNQCPYCSFHRTDNLSVPYSMIKSFKNARANGARTALFTSGERPDKFSHIRATLNLWGFQSLLDYLYTICELAFLEGLIPVIELGFLSPSELKKMSEICAVTQIMLDSVDNNKFANIYPKSPGKKLDFRIQNLEWAGKLSFPTKTGILVGIGETMSHRKELLTTIAQLHKQFGHIQEVSIQNFIPQPGTPFSGNPSPDKRSMNATIEAALSILPDDIRISAPAHLNPNSINDYISLGIRDFGYIPENRLIRFNTKNRLSIDDISTHLEQQGFQLQQRFPIGLQSIQNGHYSKKLGQIFDNYKYKIKKHHQEKTKDSKILSK